jgi:hypothetical protein
MLNLNLLSTVIEIAFIKIIIKLEIKMAQVHGSPKWSPTGPRAKNAEP